MSCLLCWDLRSCDIFSAIVGVCGYGGTLYAPWVVFDSAVFDDHGRNCNVTIGVGLQNLILSFLC